MPFIEEIDDEDIDNKHFSVEEFDSHNPFSKDTPVDPDAPVQLVPTGARQPSAGTGPSTGPSTGRAASGLAGFASPAEAESVATSSSRAFKASHSRDLPEHMKQWKVLYPVYFDKAKSVKQGRRVPIEFAVNNPLAITLAEACRSLGYEPGLELTKSHPKDWANPGRVRVNLPAGKSKREIYGQIAKFLKALPVNSQTAGENMYRQVAQFDSLQPLAVPRNMTMPKFLPGVSPALSSQKIIDDSMKMDGQEMAKMMGMR